MRKRLSDSKTKRSEGRYLPIIMLSFLICNITALLLWLNENPIGETSENAFPSTSPAPALTPPLKDAAALSIYDSTQSINGIPTGNIIVITDKITHHIKEIYQNGQHLGRNTHAFSKIGDSTIESPHFMDRFDQGGYNLGEYEYLQPVIDHFPGSFERQGVTVQRGMHAWSLFDPMWAGDPACSPGEGPVACEVRLHNPAFVFVRMGSNDVGISEHFDTNMRQLVEYCLAEGVITIIGTKADRNDGPDNINNMLLREIASDYDLPLWDFDVLAQTLPNNGMRPDSVHLTYFPSFDYTHSDALKTGYGLHNLSALMALFETLRLLSQ